MNIDSLHLIQQTRLESAAAAESHGRDAFDSAVDNLRSNAQRSYDEAMRRVEAQRGARETLSVWTLVGTIVGGLGIGSGIGMGFGELANDGDENTANDAQLEVGRADELTKLARDTMDEAREELESLSQSTRTAAGTARDIRALGWEELG